MKAAVSAFLDVVDDKTVVLSAPDFHSYQHAVRLCFHRINTFTLQLVYVFEFL